jgi:hypothetical protein
MVTAWGCEQRLVLAQVATDAKSNEITAVPELLKMLLRLAPSCGIPLEGEEVAVKPPD